MAELKKALAATGDDLATIATVIGRMLGPAKAYADCVAAFDRAIEAGSRRPSSTRRGGRAADELGDEPGASADYQAAIKANPRFAAAHYYLAGLRRSGRAQAAERDRRAYGGREARRMTEIGKRARAKVKELSARAEK